MEVYDPDNRKVVAEFCVGGKSPKVSVHSNNPVWTEWRQQAFVEWRTIRMQAGVLICHCCPLLEHTGRQRREKHRRQTRRHKHTRTNTEIITHTDKMVSLGQAGTLALLWQNYKNKRSLKIKLWYFSI